MSAKPGPARVVALTLIVLIASLLTTSSSLPASATSGFGDVGPSAFYADAVQWATDEGVTRGTGPQCFSPDALVTRSQLVVFLHRLAGAPEPGDATPFVDVDQPWQIEAVTWAFNHQVTTGISATKFEPNRLVSRGEAAVLLHRAAGAPAAASGHPFSDVTAKWQAVAWSWMYETGVTLGVTPTTVEPDRQLSRGEMVSILYRLNGAPKVKLDADTPTCDGGDQARTVSRFGSGIFATAEDIELLSPTTRVEMVGFHESSVRYSHPIALADESVRSLVMETRDRPAEPTSAIDVVVDPSVVVRAPVSGVVIRGGWYSLYGTVSDQFLIIEPTGHPGWEVKVLHFLGPMVEPGDTVKAGVTVVGARARKLPFESQVDKWSANPSWPHVHIEVNQPDSRVVADIGRDFRD